jgi:prepilin-type N-terminal cleavage/methylation domain-containing protein
MKIRALRARRRRSGFSLTEVLVAMTLLSIILMGLARVTFSMATAGRSNDVVAKRNAVLVQEANKFNAMPFDSLATVSTSDRTYTFGDFKFTRRIGITTNSTAHKTIKIVITPFYATTKKDSVFVTRTKPAGSPLCVGC